MKKKFEVLQIVSADSSTPGVEFKTVTMGGSSGNTAWAGPAIFETEQEAEEFIQNGCPKSHLVGFNEYYHYLVIVPRFQIKNPYKEQY